MTPRPRSTPFQEIVCQKTHLGSDQLGSNLKESPRDDRVTRYARSRRGVGARNPNSRDRE